MSVRLFAIMFKCLCVGLVRKLVVRVGLCMFASVGIPLICVCVCK